MTMIITYTKEMSISLLGLQFYKRCMSLRIHESGLEFKGLERELMKALENPEGFAKLLGAVEKTQNLGKNAQEKR